MRVAIDPSLTSSGIAVKNPNGTISYTRVKFDDIIGSSIANTLSRAIAMSERICGVFHGQFGKPGKLLIETPPPRSWYSAGLYMLFGLVVRRLKDTYPDLEIYGVSPMAIKSVLGSKKAKKSESVVLAKEVLLFRNSVVDKIGQDVAEAIILLEILMRGEIIHAPKINEERLNRPKIFRII